MPVPQAQGITYGHYRDTPRSIPQKVFVYGTLKKGHPNHSRFLGNAKELGPAHIEGLMFHLGAFPAINLSERFTTVYGEVYEVNWSDILAMDSLEGVGSGFYDRIEIKLERHGLAWTYIFPHQRAAREQYLVPGGMWRGAKDTPKVKWGGFGKGIEIGTFRAEQDEIKVGPGENTDWILRRSGMDNTYKLITKKTLEVIGSYTYLKDLVGTGESTKPTLGLPAGPRQSLSTVVSSIVDAHRTHPQTPIVWVPPEYKDTNPKITVTSPGIGTDPLAAQVAAILTPKEPLVPQAARLLGLKYGEA